MANERLYQFPSKASPVPADIIFAGDSADSFDEVNITIAALIAAYPNLSAYAALTLGANSYAYTNNSSVVTSGVITALAVSLLAATTAAAMQTVLYYTASPVASQFAVWDTNKNITANSLIEGYATTVTAAATTTLTVASAFAQFFTGTTTQTVVLPVTSTLQLGQQFYIVNNSTGVVTVQSSGANTVVAMSPGTTLWVTCILITGTTAASWYADYVVNTPLTLPLALASGGTNAVLAGSAGGIVYSSATALAILAGTSTAGLALLSGSNAPPVWSSSALTAYSMAAIGQLPGTTTNDAASAGKIGEFISSQIVNASAISLTTATNANLTSISLTAGDWDVRGNAVITSAGGVLILGQAGISATSVTFPDNSLCSIFYDPSLSGLTVWGSSVIQQRISLASTTTIYLVVQAQFASSTASASGILSARRVR